MSSSSLSSRPRCERRPCVVDAPRSPWRVEVETPYFTISQAVIQDNVRSLRSALPEVSLFYAVKANPEPFVLETLVALDVSFEVASIYEIELLLGIGVDPTRLAYGTAVKPSEHVAVASSSGVSLMSADSVSEIDKIARAAPGSALFIRIRVDDSRSAFAFGEKFGAEPSEAYSLVTYARERGLVCRGLSFHVGSQSVRRSAWSAAIELMRPTYEKLAADDEALPTLNIGGGFPCQYDGEEVPRIDEIGSEISRALASMPPVQLVAEPGRFIVASSATLTASVIGVSERRDSRWAFLDAGCYNGLFEAMAYQGRTAYRVTTVEPRSFEHTALFNLAGPTGDSADVIDRGVRLPADLAAGDQLVFSNVGAYTMSLAVPFNGFPRPGVVLLEAT